MHTILSTQGTSMRGKGNDAILMEQTKAVLESPALPHVQIHPYMLSVWGKGATEVCFFPLWWSLDSFYFAHLIVAQCCTNPNVSMCCAHLIVVLCCADLDVALHCAHFNFALCSAHRNVVLRCADLNVASCCAILTVGLCLIMVLTFK